MTSVVQGDVGQFLAGRMQSSSFNLSAQARFVQLLQRATVSVRMRRLDSDNLCITLEHIDKRNLILVSEEHCAERFLEITAESVDLLLRLIYCKVCKKHSNCKVSEQEIILKATIDSLKHIEGSKLVRG